MLRALLERKDQRAEGVFRQALTSSNEQVHAIGAHSLALLDAPDAVDALLATINDAPNPLHFLHTPAVQALINTGMPALPKRTDRKNKRHFCASAPGACLPEPPSATRRRPRRAHGLPMPRSQAERSAPGVGHTPQDGVE